MARAPRHSSPAPIADIGSNAGCKLKTYTPRTVRKLDRQKSQVIAEDCKLLRINQGMVKTMAPITKNRYLATLFLMTLATGCGPTPSPQPPVPPIAAAPVVTGKYISTSGNTFIQYYTYASGTCGTGTNCNFRGVIRPKSGYEQAEVFLTGFTIERHAGADKVQGMSAEVQKFRYEPATGEMEIGVNGTLQTGQPYSFNISFVVLLTTNAAAKFTHVGNGCNGVSECHVLVSSPGAVPAGKHYIGLGTRMVFLGTDSGPFNVNALSMHLDRINNTVPPGDVEIDYLCAFRDANADRKMFCEWSASIIAFDPAEMDRNDSSIFPQYTVLGNSVLVAQQHNAKPKPFSGGTISGYFDALEGMSLFYGPGQENPIWMVDASASGFQTSGSPATAGEVQYGIFMGTTFGDKVNAQPYDFQVSRAVGLLK